METQNPIGDPIPLSTAMHDVVTQFNLDVKRLMGGNILLRPTFNALGLDLFSIRRGKGGSRNMANAKGGARIVMGMGGSASEIIGRLRKHGRAFRDQGKDYRLH